MTHSLESSDLTRQWYVKKKYLDLLKSTVETSESISHFLRPIPRCIAVLKQTMLTKTTRNLLNERNVEKGSAIQQTCLTSLAAASPCHKLNHPSAKISIQKSAISLPREPVQLWRPADDEVCSSVTSQNISLTCQTKCCDLKAVLTPSVFQTTKDILSTLSTKREQHEWINIHKSMNKALQKTVAEFRVIH